MVNNIDALRNDCFKVSMGLSNDTTVEDLMKLLADLTISVSLVRADLMRLQHVDKPLTMRKNP